MQKKKLVLVDISGSTVREDIQKMIAFSKAVNADIAVFDTQLRLLPMPAEFADEAILTKFAGGGTEVARSLRMLGGCLREMYQKYHVAYIIGDLYMPPFKADDIVDFDMNFYILAMNGTRAEEEKQAKSYQKQLDACGVSERTKAISFEEYVEGCNLQLQ